MERIAMASDEVLVQASLRGEHAAFGHLVARYQDVVCAVSYSSTGDRSLSEDVAQDTFIAAWRQLGQLRETRTLRAWLCGIARNLARKARRRGGRAETLDDDELPAAGANPFEATAQAEADRVVRDALARVPDSYREVLVLYYRDGQSLAAVAQALGISEAAAQQRISRGRRYLAAGVHALVERSLRAPRRDLVVGVLAAIAAISIPARVDASPAPKGSTMFVKLALAAAAIAATTTTIYAVRTHQADAPAPAPVIAAAPAAVVTPPPVVHAPTEAPALPQIHKVAPGEAPTLEAPRVVDASTIARTHLYQGPSRGPADAKVEIVVFQDAMCHFCGVALGTIDQLFDEYPNQLRLVVKQLPVHDAARLAAEASFAADAQGKFWEMHDVMFQHQDDLSHDALISYAQQIGLDVATFTAALDQHTYAPAVAADVQTAKDLEVDATPWFVINGTMVQGARDITEFRTVINAALASR